MGSPKIAVQISRKTTKATIPSADQPIARQNRVGRSPNSDARNGRNRDAAHSAIPTSEASRITAEVRSSHAGVLSTSAPLITSSSAYARFDTRNATPNAANPSQIGHWRSSGGAFGGSPWGGGPAIR